MGKAVASWRDEDKTQNSARVNSQPGQDALEGATRYFYVCSPSIKSLRVHHVSSLFLLQLVSDPGGAKASAMCSVIVSPCAAPHVVSNTIEEVNIGKLLHLLDFHHLDDLLIVE